MNAKFKGFLFWFPFLTFAVPFKYHFYLQGRFDYGDLLYKGNDYEQKSDFYIRRFGLKFEVKPLKFLKFVSKLEGVNLFRNYKGGKEKNFPNKLLIKKLYISWEVSKFLTLKVGRDKKPFSREGLNSSRKLLLTDKTELFSKVKKFFGDYYANQVEIVFKPVKFAKIYASTFYGWHLRDKTPFGKKFFVKPKEYWFRNFVGRLEISPPGWEELKKNNTTFGKRTLVLGFSYAYVGSLEYKNKSANGYATDIDLFFRSPKTEIGKFVASFEFDRVKYLLSEGANRYLEGFQSQLGFRPVFKPFGKPLEFALGFEKLNEHPKEVLYGYETNLNCYFNKNLKLTFGVEDLNNLKLGKASLTETFQVQYTF